jgi:hypothetical protein
LKVSAWSARSSNFKHRESSKFFQVQIFLFKYQIVLSTNILLLATSYLFEIGNWKRKIWEISGWLNSDTNTLQASF